MPFYAHRCRRAGCRHPDYWSPAATYPESVTAGMTVDGVPAAQWTLERGGTRLLRASCGMSKAPGHKGCAGCARGCEYESEPFEVGQMRSDGSDVTRFFAPGEETTGAEIAVGKIYACSCDRCKEAYSLRTEDVPTVVPALVAGSLRPVHDVELPNDLDEEPPW
jgi:hypothetical protein